MYEEKAEYGYVLSRLTIHQDVNFHARFCFDVGRFTGVIARVQDICSRNKNVAFCGASRDSFCN